MRLLVMLGMLLVASFGLLLSGSPVPHASAATANVSVEDNMYVPASVTINVGDTVHWTWAGANPHTVTATDSSFDSGASQTSGTFDHPFNSAGTFTYFCQIHGAEAMSGTVVVQQAPALTPTSRPAASATPAPASTSTVAAVSSATVAAGSTPRDAPSPTVPAQVGVPPAAPPSAGRAGAAAGSQLPRAGTGTPQGELSRAGALALALGLVGAASIVSARLARRRA